MKASCVTKFSGKWDNGTNYCLKMDVSKFYPIEQNIEDYYNKVIKPKKKGKVKEK